MPFGELIEQHRVSLMLVAVHRERLAGGVIAGVIRHFSKRLILMELVAATGRLGGFTLIRREDITRVDVEVESLRRAAQAVGSVPRHHPIARELDLLDWRTAILSARRLGTDLYLRREGIGDPITFVPESVEVTKHLVLGREVGPEAEGQVALVLDQITRLDLHG